jgi:hypothetical protein
MNMKTDKHFWSHLVQFVLEWELFQTKVAEKIKTHILCSVTFPENRAVYEKMWKNTVEPDRPQMKTWCMRIACWIPKATNTHSEYVILIAFPLQQWLHEHASVLRYTYLASLVRYNVSSLDFYILCGLRFSQRYRWILLPSGIWHLANS